MAKQSIQLTASDLVVGGMYRGKHPVMIPDKFRDLQDDRMIIWMSADRTVLQYDGPAVTQGRNKPTVKVEDFLTWASHCIGVQEDIGNG